MFGEFNSFVIEGTVGVEIYKKITKAFDLCVEFDVYYEICRVNGMVYTIKKSKNEYYKGGVDYYFSVWDNVEPGDNVPDYDCSMTQPSAVELKDGNLHICEGCIARGGVLRHYIANVKLHKSASIYYYVSWDNDRENATNDIEGKYFKRWCYFEGECKIGDGTIPDNYDDLSVDEQLSICKSLKDKGVHITYSETKISDPAKFFDIKK